MKKWIKSHSILCWALGSVLWAFVIHMLFSIDAPGIWLVAKWSAGEILTYASTVALGLLALWQNNRFKEENTVSQARLEQIAVRSNEQNIINKIVDYESQHISNLRMLFDRFFQAASIDGILNGITPEAIAGSSELFHAARTKALSHAQSELDQLLFLIAEELKLDYSLVREGPDTLDTIVGAVYTAAKDVAEKTQTFSATEIELRTLTHMNSDLRGRSNKYLIERESKLQRILFEDLDLSTIREMYGKKLVEPEEMQ